ncbi:MAG: prepilin-type N-terminal cleavage/methylation domain-containing protein [Candidatus Omnitrophica bacterium]|nr:prepilin-type N-terminal cleavage/methylation domain-containing protein [Candidatus Omnitrophota bacterium]
MLSKKGLTLIELVMTIVLVGILVGVTALSIREVIGLYDFWSFRSETVSQARLSLSRMVREIRQVNNETSFLAVDRSRLQFNDTTGATIEYRTNGTDLMRNADILATGVRNLTFSYYDQNMTLLTPMPLDEGNRSLIYLIGIFLDIASGDQNRSLQTLIGPRNI